MPGIRWSQDGGGGDGYDSGQVTLFDSPSPTQTPVTTPGRAVDTYPTTTPTTPSITANDWSPSAAQTPSGQRWDANVAAFVPNSIQADPTGYVMQNGSLVGRSGASSSSSSDPYGWIDEALRSVNSTDDPAYWRRVIGADPNGNGSAKNYWIDRIRRGDGSSLVANGSLQKFQDGGVPPNPGGFDDPSSVLFLNEVMKRLMQLQQPRPDPFADLLKSLGTARVNDLQNNAPYTAGEDAALTAHYREPLTQARDAALLRNKENISARGMLPSSGLLDYLNTGTEKSYEQGIASGANDLGVRAVDERQRRLDESLTILNSLMGVDRGVQDRQDAQANEVLRLAEIFPNFDEKRLSELLQASGDAASSPASLLGGINDLGRLQLGTSAQNANNAANSSYAWAQMLYAILHPNGN